jgi:hypothetical protein
LVGFSYGYLGTWALINSFAWLSRERWRSPVTLGSQHVDLLTKENWEVCDVFFMVPMMQHWTT